MALKPRAKPEKFTDYKIEQFLHHRGKNATERLRELDKIRMYTPLPDEIQLLNVTPYRMNLLVMQDVMYLCGGLVGVRFSSEELQELLRLTKGMNSAWNDVSKAFQEMSTACKKLSLPVDEIVPGAVVEQTRDDVDLVKKLHMYADEYVQLFAQLQVFVKEKQKGVDPSARTGEFSGPCLFHARITKFDSQKQLFIHVLFIKMHLSWRRTPRASWAASCRSG